ncbi:MAG: hypothetical protein ACP5I8_15360, partial [Phycisphaerae bacterium]
MCDKRGPDYWGLNVLGTFLLLIGLSRRLLSCCGRGNFSGRAMGVKLFRIRFFIHRRALGWILELY